MRFETPIDKVYLFQRLKKPRRWDSPPANPFTFGGGLRNGGLSEAACKLLTGVWEFDHMGSAEYELGAIPEALAYLFETPCTSFEMHVPVARVKPPWDFNEKHRDRYVVRDPLSIFGICPTELREAIESVIVSILAGKHRVRDELSIEYSAYVRSGWDDYPVGWLALGAPFLFFTHKEMFDKAQALFIDKATNR